MECARNQPSNLEHAEVEVTYSAGIGVSATQPRPLPTVEEVDLRSPMSPEAEYGSPIQMGRWTSRAIASIARNRVLWDEIENGIELLLIAGEYSTGIPTNVVPSLKQLTKSTIRKAIWKQGSLYFMKNAVNGLPLPDGLKSFLLNKNQVC